VLYGNSAEVAEQNQVLLIERFLRLPAMPLKCCCLQYTTVTDVQNQKLLGSTRENFWLCVPTYTIYGPEGEEVMDVHQRACCCSCAVDCCAKDSSCCGLRVPFQLYYPGTDQVGARMRRRRARRPRARARSVRARDKSCAVGRAAGRSIARALVEQSGMGALAHAPARALLTRARLPSSPRLARASRARSLRSRSPLLAAHRPLSSKCRLSQSVGTINKMWRNFCSEFVHDDDVFRFTGPEVQVVRDTGAFQLGDIDKKIAARGEMLVRDLKSAVGITDKQYRYDLSRLPPRSWEQSSQLLAASLLLNEIHFE
jgi:hypothetical protein